MEEGEALGLKILMVTWPHPNDPSLGPWSWGQGPAISGKVCFEAFYKGVLMTVSHLGSFFLYPNLWIWTMCPNTKATTTNFLLIIIWQLIFFWAWEGRSLSNWLVFEKSIKNAYPKKVVPAFTRFTMFIYTLFPCNSAYTCKAQSLIKGYRSLPHMFLQNCPISYFQIQVKPRSFSP